MKRNINDDAILIQKRFFKALEYIIQTRQCESMKDFCNEHGLNRVKYSRLKNDINKPVELMHYKSIDIDALSSICKYNISPQWLLLGKGQMKK